MSKRRRELGIRVALGAQWIQVLNAAVGRAFRLLAFRSIAVLVLGLLATRQISLIRSSSIGQRRGSACRDCCGFGKAVGRVGGRARMLARRALTIEPCDYAW